METIIVGIKQLWTAVHLLVVTEVPAIGPVLDHELGHIVAGVTPPLGADGGHIHHLPEVKHQELVEVRVLGTPSCAAVKPGILGSPAANQRLK